MDKKSKCSRISSVSELKFSGTITKIEGQGEVDLGKDMSNYYKSKFALFILISLFIVLELS